MGLTATLHPFISFNSASRTQMVGGQKGQALQPKSPEVPSLLTGLETQLSDFTFGSIMPVDGIVVSVHHKYRRTASLGPQANIVDLSIIYQNQENGTYEVIHVKEYMTQHRVFGSKLRINPIVRTLRAGSPIARGTKLAVSECVQEDNVYTTSVQAQVAYMAMPSTIEDGFHVSEDFCDRISPLEMDSRVGSWGANEYPLNLYGDSKIYKPFPDVGDIIRPDGLIFATRTYDPLLDIVNMDPVSLKTIDMVYDNRIYGVPGAKVYDVEVLSGIGEKKEPAKTPTHMRGQTDSYIGLTRNFYDGILDTYSHICKGSRSPVMSPELQVLITRAYADQPNLKRNKRRTGGLVRRTIKKVPIDEYRVTVKYHKRKMIDKGAKISNLFGGGAFLLQVTQ